MKRVPAIIAGWSVCVALLAAQQQQPTFKSGIEIYHLDVSVLDQKRQPVRGLTAADFTVIEDGKPQKIVAFSAVDVADAIAPRAAWMRDVTPDVASNQFREQRLVLIVIDDATIPFDPRAMRRAREIGRDVVDRLGPADLAAVVFTQDNRRPQDFTNDRAKLLAAVERASYGNRTGYSFLSAVETLVAAARLLIDVPERRKTLVYISGGVPVDFEEAATPVLAGGQGVSMAGRELQVRLIERMQAAFALAARANVSIYTFDVCGLRAPNSRVPYCAENSLDVDFLRIVAANTGGRATVDTNDHRPGVVQLFQENASYYLVGYESSAVKGPGHYRRLDVRVNRPDVEVRARTRHYTEQPPTGDGRALPPAVQALAGLLPNGDIPLAVQLAPIAIPGRRDLTAVAVTMGMRQRRDPTSAAAGFAELDWEVRAFDPEGRPRGVQQQTARLGLAASGGDVQVELLTRMDLKPGAYQLRLAIHDRAQNKSGSVYADVEVPDFGKAAVSMSGVLLSASGPPAAPRDALSALVSVVPTARRVFASTDRVAAFVRVYQSGDVKKPAAPVPFTIRLTGTDETPLVNQKQTLEPPHFTARAADVNFEVPIASLKPGPYLLTLEATLGKATARRDVRFEIR
jgi:VWFA-related protein